MFCEGKNLRFVMLAGSFDAILSIYQDKVVRLEQKLVSVGTSTLKAVAVA